MTMKVQGFEALQQALINLGSVARQNTALKRAMGNALEPTADIARALVPVRTGNLKRSIIVSDTARSAPRNADVIAMYMGASYSKGARGRHAHFLEFGTVNMRPRPFLRPAWDQDGDALLRRLSHELSMQIEAAVKRKGGK
jgi:HK97 gp10 family phage protein